MFCVFDFVCACCCYCWLDSGAIGDGGGEGDDSGGAGDEEPSWLDDYVEKNAQKEEDARTK